MRLYVCMYMVYTPAFVSVFSHSCTYIVLQIKCISLSLYPSPWYFVCISAAKVLITLGIYDFQSCKPCMFYIDHIEYYMLKKSCTIFIVYTHFTKINKILLTYSIPSNKLFLCLGLKFIFIYYGFFNFI